ncbi:MAG: hypothetical protein ACUVRD_05245 [Bacteroidia bacterium]
MNLLFWFSLVAAMPHTEKMSVPTQEVSRVSFSKKVSQTYVRLFRLRDQEKRWLLIGGLVVLAGAIGGFLLPQPMGGIAAGVALVAAIVVILKLVGVF